MDLIIEEINGWIEDYNQKIYNGEMSASQKTILRQMYLREYIEAFRDVELGKDYR